MQHVYQALLFWKVWKWEVCTHEGSECCHRTRWCKKLNFQEKLETSYWKGNVNFDTGEG
jgi:hypothetical protein